MKQKKDKPLLVYMDDEMKAAVVALAERWKMSQSGAVRLAILEAIANVPKL